MKKLFTLILVIGGLSLHAQSFYQKFSVKDYAKKQTEKIQSALDLSDTQAKEVLQANTLKAHSIKKYLLLYENRGTLNGLTMKEAIKSVEKDADQASGFTESMQKILGADLYEKYLEKFKK